jgi:hypothetical protein
MNPADRKYPIHMYHPAVPPIQVISNADRSAKLAQGYTDQYQHQAFPRMVYHSSLDPITVADPGELEAKLAQGWTEVCEHVLVPQTATHPVTGLLMELPLNPNGPKVARSPKTGAADGAADGSKRRK